MNAQKLTVKNMVCQRCILAVKTVAENSGIAYKEIKLGEIELDEKPDNELLKDFERKLNELGFELISDRVNILIEKIRNAVIEYSSFLESEKRDNLSTFISRKLNYDYSYLSNLFSVVEGITVEQYFIQQRIEKAKELLVYDQLTLSEIAYKLGYSSVHHLSAQFKKITGLTPTHFKKIGREKRRPIDKIG